MGPLMSKIDEEAINAKNSHLESKSHVSNPPSYQQIWTILNDPSISQKLWIKIEYFVMHLSIQTVVCNLTHTLKSEIYGELLSFFLTD